MSKQFRNVFIIAFIIMGAVLALGYRKTKSPSPPIDEKAFGLELEQTKDEAEKLKLLQQAIASEMDRNPDFACRTVALLNGMYPKANDEVLNFKALSRWLSASKVSKQKTGSLCTLLDTMEWNKRTIPHALSLVNSESKSLQRAAEFYLLYFSGNKVDYISFQRGEDPYLSSERTKGIFDRSISKPYMNPDPDLKYDAVPRLMVAALVNEISVPPTLGFKILATDRLCIAFINAAAEQPLPQQRKLVNWLAGSGVMDRYKSTSQKINPKTEWQLTLQAEALFVEAVLLTQSSYENGAVIE